MRTLEIVNRKGLHARATAKLVQCIDRFDAAVTVSRCGETVGGTSIMGILTLGAGPGMTITSDRGGRSGGGRAGSDHGAGRQPLRRGRIGWRGLPAKAGCDAIIGVAQTQTAERGPHSGAKR